MQNRLYPSRGIGRHSAVPGSQRRGPRVPSFPLSNISEAFAISEASETVYISSFDADAETIQIWVISIATGEGTVLAEVPSTSAPAASLPSLGPDGNLFYPVVYGCLKIRQSS